MIFSSIIILLVFTISKANIAHHNRMEKLYQSLSAVKENYENNSRKNDFEDNLQTLVNKMKKRLNKDIFELQTDLFKKITNN